MSTAREKQALKMRKYRATHREQMRAYNRQRYVRFKMEKLRIERMGDKRCRLCGIRLASQSGAFGAKFYCLGCVESRQAEKHYHREATRRWRERLVMV